MNAKEIPQHVHTAILQTFQVQLDSEAKVLKVGFTLEPHWHKTTQCLSSLMLESGDFYGSMAIGFPEATVLKLIEKMTGEEFKELTPENSDAAGELLNIVYSSARKDFNETGGFNFGPSLPNTIIGSQLRLATPSNTENTLYFDCDSQIGPFYVSVSLRSRKRAAA